ncbi:MAG TPA: hypothetical protein VD973_28340 [Symbiobacteriaceae bacterium]|nr:hypothetical protein [Symbiobacteriaceae bacterium]
MGARAPGSALAPLIVRDHGPGGSVKAGASGATGEAGYGLDGLTRAVVFPH